MQLRHFEVTVQVFNITKPDGGAANVLPVGGPDEEHAVAALSNAIAFTPKVAGAEPLPFAFRCIGVCELADLSGVTG